MHGHTLLMLPRQGSLYPFSQGMDIPDIEIVVVYGVPGTVSVLPGIILHANTMYINDNANIYKAATKNADSGPADSCLHDM